MSPQARQLRMAKKTVHGLHGFFNGRSHGFHSYPTTKKVV